MGWNVPNLKDRFKRAIRLKVYQVRFTALESGRILVTCFLRWNKLQCLRVENVTHGLKSWKRFSSPSHYSTFRCFVVDEERNLLELLPSIGEYHNLIGLYSSAETSKNSLPILRVRHLQRRICKSFSYLCQLFIRQKRDSKAHLLYSRYSSDYFCKSLNWNWHLPQRKLSKSKPSFLHGESLQFFLVVTIITCQLPNCILLGLTSSKHWVFTQREVSRHGGRVFEFNGGDQAFVLSDDDPDLSTALNYLNLTSTFSLSFRMYLSANVSAQHQEKQTILCKSDGYSKCYLRAFGWWFLPASLRYRVEAVLCVEGAIDISETPKIFYTNYVLSYYFIQPCSLWNVGFLLRKFWKSCRDQHSFFCWLQTCSDKSINTVLG